MLQGEGPRMGPCETRRGICDVRQGSLLSPVMARTSPYTLVARGGLGSTRPTVPCAELRRAAKIGKRALTHRLASLAERLARSIRRVRQSPPARSGIGGKSFTHAFPRLLPGSCRA